MFLHHFVHQLEFKLAAFIKFSSFQLLLDIVVYVILLLQTKFFLKVVIFLLETYQLLVKDRSKRLGFWIRMEFKSHISDALNSEIQCFHSVRILLELIITLLDSLKYLFFILLCYRELAHQN
jgi:hypothetical protein